MPKVLPDTAPAVRQPAPRRPMIILARALVAAAALGLAVVPMLQLSALATRQEQMAAWLGRSGIVVPRELEHEPDPGRVELRAARASLAAELDPARHLDLAPAEDARQRAEAATRLGETAGLAAGAFADRPAAWEAAMVVGAATYLSWSLARDSRLFTAAPAWQHPLDAAIALAPGRNEAARLLAGIYLEIWPALSPAKRARERQLLAGVFSDPQAFSSLIGPWLATAASREDAFAVMPATPEAWAKLQTVYQQEGDWPGFCAARERWDLALRTGLANRLAEAEARRAGGDSRDLYLEVALEARPGRHYVDLLTRALENCPPGSVDRRTAQRLGKHLEWSLERCRLDRCPLSPRALRRLAGFCRDVDPRVDAMAALVTGDLPRAEVLERTYATQWSEDWAAYRLLKAKLLAERGRGAESAAALAGMPESWASRPSYWQVRAAVARSTADPAAEAAAARGLARLSAREWPASAWDFHGGVARLELLAAAAAPGFEITLDEAPPRGAAAEFRLDTSILGTFPVAARTTLALDAPLAPGLHLLEVENVTGGALLPGSVRLLSAAGSGRDGAGEPR